MELESKHPTAEPISLPLGFLESITSNFSKEQEIGSGGCGVVYKGILPCGSVIAIKKFDERILAGDDGSFEDEASSLMDIKHQNIVQLLGFCAESRGATLMKKPNGKGTVVEQLTKMLCFEYMCEGGLDKHLSDESSGLEWNKRYKIIKGICSGLKYLHERSIIHRDLKPQNILMDTTMVPKIADFGLSRSLGEQKSYTVTSNRAGTLGYMAPEYIERGVVSKKADIFSLGVIIIEIIKGCKDYPDYGQSTDVFTEKVLNNWRNRFERSSDYYTALELHIQLVKQCINIALECVHPDKEKRPNVSNIIKTLNAVEGSCCVQNGEDLLVDHEMGTQERLTPSGVLREALKDHVQAWRTKGMMASAVAPLQPLGALCYQGARNTSFWVVHKALASLEDNALKDWAATFNLGPSVEALERELKSVKVILELALGKVIHNLALEDILTVLRELVYDAEDVLDEMEYFRIQGDEHARGCAHNLDLNVLPSVHDEPPKWRFHRNNASQRIEHIVKQMQLVRQEVSSTITLLGSDWSTAPNIAQSRPITISESIEPKLYGRELMMKSILYDITKGKHSAEVLTVIPIVGPGGIGKTTLAQHIYNSGEVQNHFDVRVWTCVSLNFNVKKLTEEIEIRIPKVDHESSNGTAGELIGQRLKDKRLLLVLDDLWDCSDEDEWKRLLVPFRKSQVQGNIIIVTTRLPAQARIMVQKNDQSIYLQGIEIKDFEELFLQIIFGDDDQSRKDHTFLLETGFRIAGRLKGSPLAAKTVGRLLKTNLDLGHWIRILENKEWEHSDGKNDIMHALKLSFDYLPSQLQLCFSYCALFPQDYIFERQELINFWIGQEVLHSSHGENKRVEDIGLNHLTELINYGFLENGEEEDVITIHDLLHELARKVSSLEFLSIDSSQSQVSSLKVLPSVRHLSINIGYTSANDRLTLTNCVEDYFNTLDKRLKVEKLRTLMIFGEQYGCFVKVFGDLFRKAKALRLVFLNRASCDDVKDLLHNFDYLIHLRYLRIACCWPYEKARFPNIISRFYHMKVLDAKHSIINLPPTDIGNLVKLRHLLVKDNAEMHSSIVGVGKLKSLQELRRFVVRQDIQGFELRQIGNLEELCGSLCIDRLENVQVPEEANEAKLMLKSRLHELILRWNNNSLTDDSALEEHILERLKPSSTLQELSIIGHRGGSCPSWLGMNLSLSNLKSLCLDDVNWKTFPPIGDLWLANVPHEKISINIPEKRFGNLRLLVLKKLSGLKTWAVHAPRQLFPYLEVLIIRDCSQLVELSFSHSDGCCQQGKEVNVNLFPRLEMLEIENCPQLSSFPPVPWTEARCSIEIQGTSSLSYLSYQNEYRDEEHILTIEGNEDTDDSTFWNVLAFHNLTRLERLSMCRCRFPPLRYIQMLSSLRNIHMSCPSNVFPFFEADCQVKYQFLVESLAIDEWNASGMELTQLLTYFPKLSDLKLWRLEGQQALNVMGHQATETPGPSSSSANKVEHQQDERAEDDLIVASEEAKRDLMLLPPQLQELAINCRELNPHDDSNEEDGRTGGGEGLQALTSLRRLKIKNCPELLSSSYSSSSLSSAFPFPNSLEYLDIYGAVGMDTLVHLSNLTRLKSLSLSHSRGEGLLTLLTQDHPTKLPVDSEHSQVHEQEIPSCSFKLQEPPRVRLSNLTSLTSLSVTFCDLRGEGLLSLLTQGHLTKFSVRKTPNFYVDSEPPWVHEQELPSHSSKLQELEIDDVSGFTAAPIRHNLIFSALKELEICEDDKVERFTEEQEALLFVNSLEVITFESCRSLQSLPERLHGLPNLKRLRILWCYAIQKLPKDGLPSSLQELEISSCPNIRLLPKDCLPDSLQRLCIYQCPAIQSLPKVDDLPSSLREIDVRFSGSEELWRQCRELINIIPLVRVDYTLGHFFECLYIILSSQFSLFHSQF